MEKVPLYFAVTIAAVFLALHTVARINIAHAVLASDEDRRRMYILTARGILQGLACMAVFAFLLSRPVGVWQIAAAGALGLWLFIECCRITRLLILIQSVMTLHKRNAKGGGMNSGPLAAMLSGAAGLLALIGALTLSRPSDLEWQAFRTAHRCSPVSADSRPVDRTDIATPTAPDVDRRQAWLCEDGRIYYR